MREAVTDASQVTYTLLASELSLAQIYIGSGQAEKAVALLETAGQRRAGDGRGQEPCRRKGELRRGGVQGGPAGLRRRAADGEGREGHVLARQLRGGQAGRRPGHAHAHLHLAGARAGGADSGSAERSHEKGSPRQGAQGLRDVLDEHLGSQGGKHFQLAQLGRRDVLPPGLRLGYRRDRVAAGQGLLRQGRQHVQEHDRPDAKGSEVRPQQPTRSRAWRFGSPCASDAWAATRNLSIA